MTTDDKGAEGKLKSTKNLKQIHAGGSGSLKRKLKQRNLKDSRF